MHAAPTRQNAHTFGNSLSAAGAVCSAVLVHCCLAPAHTIAQPSYLKGPTQVHQPHVPAAWVNADREAVCSCKGRGPVDHSVHLPQLVARIYQAYAGACAGLHHKLIYATVPLSAHQLRAWQQKLAKWAPQALRPPSQCMSPLVGSCNWVLHHMLSHTVTPHGSV